MRGIHTHMRVLGTVTIVVFALLICSHRSWAESSADPAAELGAEDLDRTKTELSTESSAQPSSEPSSAAETVDNAETAERAVLISEIAIVGNNQVEGEAIRIRLTSRPGTLLNEETVDADIRSIYQMGFFSNIEASLTDQDGKTTLTYRVWERPLIRQVRVEGQKKITKEDLLTALKIHPRTILNPVKIRRGILDAKKLYEEKGYLDTDVSYHTETTGNGESILTFTVAENDTTSVTGVIFEGNERFSGKVLQGFMQTRKKNFLSRFMPIGILSNEALKTDIERLTAFYYDHGYINVRIDEPQVERREDGLFITIRIEEGDKFKVGEVHVTGDVPGGETAAKSLLTLRPNRTFKASVLRDDVFALTGYFSDQGYAFVNVEPETEVQPDEKLVNVSYRVDQGPEVYIDRVEIAGNTKTRDKVIRRELTVFEQSLFAASALQHSRDRVQRLGHFEDVNLTTKRGKRKDLLNILVDVKESQTGSFSLGAGFNSATSVVGNARVQENNLMGRGQRLILGASIGTRYRNTQFNFMDPYFLDTRLRLGLELFDWRFAFEDFDRSGTGGGFRLFYPLSAMGYSSIWGYSLQDVELGFQYQWERSRISNFEPITPDAVRAERGSQTTSLISPTIMRNTLNHPLEPTAGSLQQISVGFAGLGGDNNYNKVELEARYFLPVWRSRRWGTFTLMTGGIFGYGVGDISFTENRAVATRRQKILEDDIPLFDRYFPGGINSIRGFGERSLGPREEVVVVVRDDNTPDGRKARTFHRPIGGSHQLIINNEVVFPIVPALNLKGVVFNDIGNAFTNLQGIELSDLRYSVGAGVRWKSPFGPIRIELGRPLNAKNDERTSTIHFSFGGFGGIGQGGGGNRFGSLF